ncbi:MAG TPA: peptidase T, partial [Oscillospiraceae bacterium]|nr:peptidase T [Oscillospiraceae bacterium]
TADTGYDYKNMRVVIEQYPHLIDTAYEAIREVGGEPKSVAVRGGTDGCMLSFMGLPCPNLGTGGYNFHGRYEFACVEDMDLAAETVVKIAEKYADFKK